MFLTLLLFVPKFTPQEFTRLVRDLPQPLFQRLPLFGVQRFRGSALEVVAGLAGVFVGVASGFSLGICLGLIGLLAGLGCLLVGWVLRQSLLGWLLGFALV